MRANKWQPITFFERNRSTTNGTRPLRWTIEEKGTFVLSGFHFRFDNGDHKIKTIGVMPGRNYVQFTYADGNGDDPFTARVQFIKPTGADLQVIALNSKDQFGAPAYNCNTTVSCSWIIGTDRGVPNRFVPILSGFYFEQQAADANIGGISAGWYERMQDAEGGFQALMTDDGGWDLMQGDRQSRNTLFRGAVTLVPSDKIERCANISRRWWGDNTNRPSARGYDSVRLAPNKRFVLQRVSFGFADDNFLEQIGVQYFSDGELLVHFKDNNRDDYYWWNIGYCYLKE